ncbi:16S rRNA (cytidine(1402)-2'-O)-methyltransferase [Sporanaerobium hydrogeniformans]|uniref:16S rRNA (Cytidine(1402)-2'-O)-methyltransferase n=1 Tax=Sporanaerobium hydrogeniformans TaxID=3072179 RepID=A0AC61D876_9FIRM|nr:16S rRNA (cytidine(1402)-2'-O)-methyltransferase [Sporanaerobium hydrogeniformans]PHV69387.1 16S rRNA (cytidine(1402)-2'-O)-methyltransferase [Sporanaerobium hydrogeniformans]
MSEYGVLTLCATPIGNLEDMTYRGVRLLKEADFIAAEDTRHTKKLLNHFEIHTKLISYHEHNKMEKGLELISLLKEGKNIVLVTDAGTPGISDPGEDLVRLAIEESITVTSAPGAVAGITALIISGQSTRRFVFEGFLPSNKKEKLEVLERLKEETRTIIMYEAPHRLIKTLKSLYEALGDRGITITKELTKKHEMAFKTTIEGALARYEEEEPRGEYVLVIQGKDFKELQEEAKQEWTSLSIEEHMQHYLNQGMDEKSAMKVVAKDRGVGKREIYAYLHK